MAAYIIVEMEVTDPVGTGISKFHALLEGASAVAQAPRLHSGQSRRGRLRYPYFVLLALTTTLACLSFAAETSPRSEMGSVPAGPFTMGSNTGPEDEWEKAARGTDGRKYPWGNAPPDRSRARFAAGWNETAPVDNHATGISPYGVQDMAGNAWEWVASAYRPYPSRADDGREDLAAGPLRATRGGGHDSPAKEITTTQRGRNLSRNPRSGHHNIGFRCVK